MTITVIRLSTVSLSEFIKIKIKANIPHQSSSILLTKRQEKKLLPVALVH